MKKINYFLAFALGVTNSAFIAETALAGTTMDTLLSDGSITDANAVVAHEGCAKPTSRDYHDVLAAYDADASDDYKFSGCGGVI